MAYQLTVHLPGTPEGQEVSVTYLGRFRNGKTHELTEEQVRKFNANSPSPFPESGHLYIPISLDPEWEEDQLRRREVEHPAATVKIEEPVTAAEVDADRAPKDSEVLSQPPVKVEKTEDEVVAPEDEAPKRGERRRT